MPPKKNFSNSINPELYERSQQPASTIAMGMKSSQASSLAWQDQVRREQALQERWAAAYDPAATQEAKKEEALQHTLTREADRREQYRGVRTNPELHEILYQESLEELERQAASEATGGATFTANPNKGPTHATTQVPVPTRARQKALPPATGPIPYHDGSARAAHEPSAAPDADGHEKKYKSRTEEYLTVRADTRRMAERFPQGPKTGTQVIGWQAYNATDNNNNNSNNVNDINSAVYQTAKARQSKGPYRRPEDATHAQLLGYDLEEK